MGMSDYHIYKIKKVVESDVYCPNCGNKVLFIEEAEIGSWSDSSVHYCPKCEIYFDFDSGYYTDEKTEGIEKIDAENFNFT